MFVCREVKKDGDDAVEDVGVTRGKIVELSMYLLLLSSF